MATVFVISVLELFLLLSSQDPRIRHHLSPVRPFCPFPTGDIPVTESLAVGDGPLNVKDLTPTSILQV